jgi:hypothetical protein
MSSQSQNPFTWRHFQADIILLCVRWYLRYALSYRDLEEMMLERVRRVSGEREYFGEGCWKALSAPDLPRPAG